MPSLRTRVLNRWLKLTEKPYLARAENVVKLRRSFEAKARCLFHPPRGTRFQFSVLGGIPALKVDGPACATRLLYLHGGGYVFGSTRTHSALVAQLCKTGGLTGWSLDYRLAPEHPFPAALEDALVAYKALIEGDAEPQVVIGGDSAGGGLALALLGEICKRGLPQPLGVFAFSPLTDATSSGDSILENEAAEVVLPAARIGVMKAMYLGGTPADDPRVSPLFEQFGGACPVWLAVGDTEILRDDSLRMAARLEAQGVDVQLTVERDLPHVWPIFHNYIPEARRTIGALADWIRSL